MVQFAIGRINLPETVKPLVKCRAVICSVIPSSGRPISPLIYGKMPESGPNLARLFPGNSDEDDQRYGLEDVEYEEYIIVRKRPSSIYLIVSQGREKAQVEDAFQ
jgi:hypothetical protein